MRIRPALLVPGWLVALTLVSLGTASWSPRPAFAQPEEKKPDAAGAKPDDKAMDELAKAFELMTSGKPDEALTRLTSAFDGCEKCDPTTRAYLLSALGVVTGDGKADLVRAGKLFVMALREDPTIQLDRQIGGRGVQQAFAEAQKEVKAQPAGPGKGATRLPPNKDQVAAVDAAKQLLAAGNWSECMGTILGVGDAEFGAGKLLIARCQDSGGLILEAMKDAQLAAEYAKAETDATTLAAAKELIAKLEVDTPKVVVLLPASIDNPVIKIDGIVFDKAAAKAGIPRNPGKATVEVTGKKGRFPFTFKTVETFDRGENVTVDVAQSEGSASSAVQQCLASATTAVEVSLCLETGGKGRGLTFRGGLEVTSYNDTHDVDVVSPAIKLSFENPTQGWQIGGSALLDVVSAASPDIVATASRRFDQARVGATIGGDVKIDVVKIGVGGGLSYENDYIGRSLNGRVSADVFDKRLTPALAYTFGYDTVGNSGVGFDIFGSDVFIHAIDASMSAVLSAETLFSGAATFIYETGDQSKPYRHVPLFSEAVASDLPRGATPDLVASSRLPLDPLEQLPTERLRGATGFGVRHRFETFTLRVDERLYLDSWGLKASTTDGRLPIDLSEEARIGPHVRFHIQSGVDFWQRAYTASGDPLTIPVYRTGDREMGPLFGITAGGFFRYEITPGFAAGLSADAVYTQFLDHINVVDRLGVFTASTLELVVE